MERYKLSITLTQPILGSQPQREVATDYLRAKAIDKGAAPEDVDETINTIPEELEKGTTAFHRDSSGAPCLWDYQVKGFLKEAGQVFNGEANGSKVKNLRSKIAATVFVQPRVISLVMPEDGAELTINERPLRAMTMQGPRVSLARSEQLPEGTHLECVVTVLKPEIGLSLLKELLDYGQFQGFGQWRSGGFGTFSYILEPC